MALSETARWRAISAAAGPENKCLKWAEACWRELQQVSCRDEAVQLRDRFTKAVVWHKPVAVVHRTLFDEAVEEVRFRVWVKDGMLAQTKGCPWTPVKVLVRGIQPDGAEAATDTSGFPRLSKDMRSQLHKSFHECFPPRTAEGGEDKPEGTEEAEKPVGFLSGGEIAKLRGRKARPPKQKNGRSRGLLSPPPGFRPRRPAPATLGLGRFLPSMREKDRALIRCHSQ